MIEAFTEEFIENLFADTSFRPILRLADIPVSVEHFLSRLLHPSIEELQHEYRMEFYFGGFSEEAIFIYSYSYKREFPESPRHETLYVFPLRDGEARTAYQSYVNRDKALTFIKWLFGFGTRGWGDLIMPRWGDEVMWSDEGNSSFEDTEYSPIHRLTDIPTLVSDFLLREALQHENYRPELLTRLSQIVADVGQPYNAGCVRKKGLPGRQFLVGGHSNDAVFLFTTSGGIAPSRDLWIFELTEGKAFRVFSGTVLASVPRRDPS